MNNKKNLLIIGCGGNGSNLVKYLIEKNLICDLVKDYNIYLIDGDKVEHKNIERQFFREGDVKEYKAVCLYEKLNYHLTLNKVEDFNINVCLEYNPEIDIIPHITIIAVDNQMSRRYYKREILDKYFNDIELYIDCGNDLLEGQIFCINKNTDQITINLYESFLQTPDNLEVASCSNLEQSKEINNIIAYSIYLILKEFVENNKIKHSFIKITPENDNKPLFKHYIYQIPVVGDPENNDKGFILIDLDDYFYFNRITDKKFNYFIYKNYTFKVLNKYIVNYDSNYINLDKFAIVETNNVYLLIYNKFNGLDKLEKMLKKRSKDYIIYRFEKNKNSKNSEKGLDNIITRLYNKGIVERIEIGCIFNDETYKELKTKLLLRKHLNK